MSGGRKVTKSRHSQTAKTNRLCWGILQEKVNLLVQVLVDTDENLEDKDFLEPQSEELSRHSSCLFPFPPTGRA